MCKWFIYEIVPPKTYSFVRQNETKKMSFLYKHSTQSFTFSSHKLCKQYSTVTVYTHTHTHTVVFRLNSTIVVLFLLINIQYDYARFCCFFSVVSFVFYTPNRLRLHKVSMKNILFNILSEREIYWFYIIGVYICFL